MTNHGTPQPRVILVSPFMPLIYNWDKLNEAEKVTANDTSERREARADLGKLLEYVQSSVKLEPYFKNRLSNISSNVVSFEYLWTIFPSGAEVIATTFLDEQQILIVDRPPFAVENEKKLSLWCWYFDHDGNNFFPVMIEFKIENFQGTKPITSLPCYPLQYYEKKDQKIDGYDLKTWLIKRGKDFHHFCTTMKGAKRMCDYRDHFLSIEGYIMSQDMGDEKIIIDPEAFLEYAAVPVLLGEREVYTIHQPGQQHDISDEKKYLMAPPRILGWSVRRKTWCQFGIRGIEGATMANHEVFEKELELDGDIKKMIRALVNHHENSTPTQAKNPDLIEGKGRSLVMLFHGPPGVGKTLTAEAISEETGRPLYTVSVADIGLTASNAEANLHRLFQLASRWEAILLVDEADVFLESRVRESDPNRNALVSVLLRVLEYYQGIMILTTNRIKSLDVAIQSRIHLAIRYDDLTREQMKNILDTILNKFKPRKSDKDEILKYFHEFTEDTKIKLNGRQIRNLVSSAQAIASSNHRDSISRVDFRQILIVTRDFQEQLNRLVEQERMRREVTKDGT
ncbi:MAG: hypothetical protein Q9167_001174 [Letrouitia subvulpina]